MTNSEQPTAEGRDQLLSEAASIQQAKLRATRAEQASMSRASTRSGSSASSPMRHIGEVVAGVKTDWRTRFAPLIERARAEREAKTAAFLANGGECLDCFDEGPCEFCERGQAEIERQRQRAIRGLVEASGLPARFQSATFATYPGKPAVRDALSLFVAGWGGRQNLILLGKYGVGKTGLFGAAVNALAPRFHESGRTVVFTTTPSLFDRFKAGFDDGSYERELRRCQNATLLILDDLGAEKPTPWVLERFYAIVNARYEAEKPTWISSNLTPDGITAAVGERVWYRLKEGARVVEVTGPNLRERRA